MRESDMKTPSRARIMSEAMGVVGWLATEISGCQPIGSGYLFR
ncbi:MAG: hypothetical protein E4G89_05400 [Methanothrix sp.]|nr:MAG: hypothetical protein E4G89_05400 [Methanothrix sp.]